MMIEIKYKLWCQVEPGCKLINNGTYIHVYQNRHGLLDHCDVTICWSVQPGLHAADFNDQSKHGCLVYLTPALGWQRP